MIGARWFFFPCWILAIGIFCPNQTFADLLIPARIDAVRIQVPLKQKGEYADYLEETRSDHKHWFKTYYSLTDGKPQHLTGIEKIDAESRATIAYKHRILLNGKAQWTQWLPASLGTQGSLAWGKASKNIFQIERVDTEPLKQADAILELEVKSFQLFDDLLQIRSEPEFEWKPGTYHWAYSPKKLKMWSGYLWDFKDGRLFRGYRVHRDPSVQSPLSPSEMLTSGEIQGIKAYYDQLPNQKSIKESKKEESVTYSPLDKYGIWAERDQGITWWLPSAWEASHHFTQFSWGGYCNSSAVLPFLWDRPTQTVLDRDVWFDPRDLAGIMQAASYQVESHFWGERFSGDEGDDTADPNPKLVVDVLKEYLGKQQIPLIYDWEAGPSVGNLVILWAELQIQPTQEPKHLHATLILHSVGNLEDTRATAIENEISNIPDWNGSTSSKEFAFEIELNSDDSFKSAHWTDPSKHPDFLWLPIGLRDYSAPHLKNPYLKIKDVQRLIEKSQPKPRSSDSIETP